MTCSSFYFADRDCFDGLSDGANKNLSDWRLYFFHEAITLMTSDKLLTYLHCRYPIDSLNTVMFSLLFPKNLSRDKR